MPFSDEEIARHIETVEERFWSHRRPALHLRDKVREGQRISGNTIELFYVRPAFRRPGEFVEESIVKLTFVKSRNLWKLSWKRATGKWHGYTPHPETTSLASALDVVHHDVNGCFFG